MEKINDPQIVAAILSIGLFIRSDNVGPHPEMSQILGFYEETLEALKNRELGGATPGPLT